MTTCYLEPYLEHWLVEELVLNVVGGLVMCLAAGSPAVYKLFKISEI